MRNGYTQIVAGKLVADVTAPNLRIPPSNLRTATPNLRTASPNYISPHLGASPSIKKRCTTPLQSETIRDVIIAIPRIQQIDVHVRRSENSCVFRARPLAIPLPWPAEGLDCNAL